MAKGYWVATLDITDPEAHKAYVAANAEPIRKYGGRFLIRGGKSETMEGKLRSRIIVLEFPDFASALACYRSPEYQKAFKLRAGKSETDLVVIEGFEGVQP